MKLNFNPCINNKYKLTLNNYLSFKNNLSKYLSCKTKLN